jgi:hypothetical protein
VTRARLVVPAVLVMAALAGGRAPARADGPLLPADAVPAGLRGDAPAVIRDERLHFQVDSEDRATMTVHRAVTIYSREAQEDGYEIVFYDGFSQVTKFEAALYNARGDLLRRLDPRAVIDRSAISGFSLYEDSRARIGGLVHTTFPYTVVIDYQVRFKGLMNWPQWHPTERGRPLERTSLVVSAPLDVPFRWQVRHLGGKPGERVEDDRRIVTWVVRNLPGRPLESLFNPAAEAPEVLVAPERFRLHGREGSMATWQSFGAWHWDLWKERRALPPDVVAHVRTLTDGVADPAERARLIYDDLQKTTRYVSIQLGIGGWQPHPAEAVARTGYGDCKGLVNLAVASLEVAGVTAHPALVRAGAGAPDVPPDFPCNQFNHVIVCVPLAPDTLWLECTSRDAPAGWLGSFTEDRNVLLLTPEGGLLRRTPAVPASANRRERSTRVALSVDGGAELTVRCAGSGAHRDRLVQALAHGRSAGVDRWLLAELEQPLGSIQEFDAAGIDRDGRRAAFSCRVQVSALGNRSGNRRFIHPVVMDRWNGSLPDSADLAGPLVFLSTMSEVDTFLVDIPFGLRAESIPTPIHLTAPFGRYDLDVSADTSTIRVVRQFEISRKLVPPAEFGILRAFADAASRGDNGELVLLENR